MTEVARQSPVPHIPKQAEPAERDQPAEPDPRLEPYERLSPRERQVLVGLANGLSPDAMARTWSLSEATVRSQIRALLVKLGVASQPAAVAAARRAGWLAAAPEG